MKSPKHFYSILSIVLIALVSKIAFADNKTGSFEEDFQGSHYCAYVPEDCAKSKDLSLVVALHGAGGSARNFITAWTGVAKENKFAVIAIKSKGQTWRFDTSPKFVLDAIEDFKKHCSFNEKRILLSGFSAGAHVALHMGIKYNKHLAIAPVGGGCQTQFLTDSEMKAASDIPIYYIAGENDPNLAPIKTVKEQLEGYGYKVQLDVAPGLGHNYPNDASEKFWKWFDKIGPMHNIEKIKTKAEKAFEDKKLVEAFDFFYQLQTQCNSIPAKYKTENKDKLKELEELAEEKLKSLKEIWKKKEPDAFKQIEKCYKYIEKNKLFDAAKNFEKILDKFPDTNAAELAKIKIQDILSENMDVADKLAGSKPKSALSKAEKTLNKSNLKDEDKQEAIETLEKIIADFPYSSYAKAARELIEKFK